MERLRQFDPLYRHLSVVGDRVSRIARCVQRIVFYSADHGEDMLDDDRERFLHASPTTTCWQLHVASLAWFSEDYKRVFPNRRPLPPAMKTLRRRHMRFFRPSPTSPVSRRITFTGRRRWQVPPTIRRCGAVTSTITTVPYRSVRRGLNGTDLAYFRRRGIEL